MRKGEGVVCFKGPFGGPEGVLAYLSRYTHRVAIANSRLIAFDDNGVTFKWKDYRSEGHDRYKMMTLAVDEFIRRFLIHVLPGGFHRIRHYGLFASGSRAHNIATARELLGVPASQAQAADPNPDGTEPATPPPASLPMLRRPHDHHRALHARLLAAHPSDNHDQHRHVMMTVATSRCTNDHSCRRFSIGSGGTCSN